MLIPCNVPGNSTSHTADSPENRDLVVIRSNMTTDGHCSGESNSLVSVYVLMGGIAAARAGQCKHSFFKSTTISMTVFSRYIQTHRTVHVYFAHVLGKQWNTISLMF